MIDKIYIICKKTHYNRKQLCKAQLDSYGINNYIFIDAIFPSENSVLFEEYNKLTKNMDSSFKNANFTMGAFGCLLSHIECIKNAKKNNLKNILILEEDFIICKDYIKKYNLLSDNLKTNNIKWNLIYLGKKQGSESKYNKLANIHIKQRFNKIYNLNEFFYIPNYQTWGTHSLLINNIIFDEILNFQNYNIVAPYDLLLMTLYHKFNFLCVKDDLFITNEEYSDIREITNTSNLYTKWNWNTNLYKNIQKCDVKNIIIYDFKNSEHTHQYIHKMYYEFFKFYYTNLNILWCNNFEEIPNNINFSETMFFISPCHKEIFYTLPEKSFYVIHLDFIDNNITDFNNLTDKFFNNHKNVYEANQYIILTCREGINNIQYFEKNIDKKIICLPWFSNNLYSQINALKNNLINKYNNNSKKQYFCFYGSIWKMNIDIIYELINVCINKNYKLILRGRVFGINGHEYMFLKTINSKHNNIVYESYDRMKSPDDYENTFKYLDDKYGVKILLPLQGVGHHDKYISNRIFETLSNGYPVITNCAIVKKYFNNAIYNNNLSDLINECINIVNDFNLWINLMNKQIDEYINKFYGYNNIKNLMDFIYDTNIKNDKLISYNLNYVENKKYNVWIKKKYDNKINTQNYKIINNNDDLNNASYIHDNYILFYDNNYDIFLLNKLLHSPGYDIIVDKICILETELINILCGTNYSVNSTTNKLKISCILTNDNNRNINISNYLKSDEFLLFNDIFDFYDKNETYSKSIDSQLGVLKNIKLFKLTEENIEEYFQQFIDYTENCNCSNLVIRLTFDFNIDPDRFINLKNIINLLIKNNVNFYYLYIDDLDKVISNKLSNIYTSTKKTYKELLDELPEINKINNINNNKFKYTQLINTFINSYTYLDYNSMFNNLDYLNNILSKN